MQTEEDRPLGIGWRELDIPIIASFRTQLGPDVMRTDGLPSRKRSIRRKRKERRRLIKYWKVAWGRVTWVPRLGEPGINTARQPAGKRPRCWPPPTLLRPSAQRRGAQTSRGTSGRVGCGSARALYCALSALRYRSSRRLAGLDGRLRTAGSSRGTTGGLRETGIPSALSTPCLPPHSLLAWRYGLVWLEAGDLGLGRREFEILGLVFPNVHMQDFSPLGGLSCFQSAWVLLWDQKILFFPLCLFSYSSQKSNMKILVALAAIFLVSTQLSAEEIGANDDLGIGPTGPTATRSRWDPFPRWPAPFFTGLGAVTYHHPTITPSDSHPSYPSGLRDDNQRRNGTELRGACKGTSTFPLGPATENKFSSPSSGLRNSLEE